MRQGGIDEAEIICMAELLTLIYTRPWIEEQAAVYKEEQFAMKRIYERVFELTDDPVFMMNIELLRITEENDKKGDGGNGTT
jgi:hypothetical protein